MAQINDIIRSGDEPNPRTSVSADYSFNENIFQLRTYKEGDVNRNDTSKQNIQLDIKKAQELINLLNDFVNQD
jgi:two-component sensor histidine kinase